MLPLAFVAQPPTTATFNSLFDLYFYIGLVGGIATVGVLIFFLVRYRAGRRPVAVAHHRSENWKIVLAVVAIMIVLISFTEYQDFASFTNVDIPNSPNAVHIRVLAFQWGWNFTYPNGKYQLNNLTVPVNTVVVLNITSRDVAHSFGIPMFAEKEDAIPGKVNQLWFNATQPGFFKDAIRCYELCGVGHAFMIANLTVVSSTAWSKWMSSGG
jgi:cytochrome c oxidase subunit 2